MATQLLTATGSAGVFAPDAFITDKHAQALTAIGSARTSGSAATVRILPSGGMTDFGLWIAGQPDTAMSRDMAHSTGTDSTATRSWLTASAPTAYAPGGTQLWNAAVYAGIGIKWTSLAAGEKHSYDNIQMEQVSTGNRLSWEATSWEGRRCYISSGTSYCSIVASTDAAFSGTRSGKITYLGAPAGAWGYSISPTTPLGMAPCTPGEVLNGSVSVNMQRAAWWTAALQFYDASYNQIPTSTTWYYSAYRQHPGAGTWDTSYVYSITAPASATWVAVVPHISINSTPGATDHIAPIGEVAYCDMHRIWARTYNVLGAPTTYTTPRKLTIKVRANRVNLINNPGLDSDLWSWGAGGNGTAPFPNSWDGTVGHTKPGSLKFTIPPNPTSYGLSSVVQTGLLTGWSSSQIGGFGWRVNSTYTTSVYVKLGPGCPNVTLISGGYTPSAGVLSTDDALANHQELIDGDWIRLWATVTTSSEDDGLVGMILYMNSADIPATGATFWVDDALSESGDQLLPYFDGGSPGSDYLWAGTPSRSSSHYYRGFRSNLYRLNDIVHSAVPHATQYTLLYAQPPT